jgi:hypothetical protein
MRSELEPGLTASANLFIEAVAKCPRPAPARSFTPPFIHLFRANLCQSAVLSDIPGLGEGRPLRFISLGTGEDHCKWLKRFQYQPLNVAAPAVGVPLWERVAWSADQGLRESAHWGIWRAIQRYFRGGASN